jgi:hypothetical protein
MTKNRNEWFEYHRRLEEQMQDWKIIPNDEIIERYNVSLNGGR